jgi:hypothetical protein
MIFNAYIADKGRARFVKLLDRFAKGNIHRNWLRIQFEKLADNNEDFDYSENWNALCINKQGEEDVYQLLYLFRLLFFSYIIGFSYIIWSDYDHSIRGSSQDSKMIFF